MIYKDRLLDVVASLLDHCHETTHTYIYDTQAQPSTMATKKSKDAEIGRPHTSISVDNGKLDDVPQDEAARFVAAHADYPPMTPEMEKRIKKKIDAWIIPLGVFTTTLAAVDKVQLSTAALYDFLEDNDLTGSEFSWLGSILSVGVSCPL